MTCETCGAVMKERSVTKERPYYYAIGGLPQFPLTTDVRVSECTKCRAESVEIQAPGRLHRKIARALLAKPVPLTSNELRFLRKNAGFSAQRFAEMIGVDPAHLSRIENGKRESLGITTERLARAIVAMAEDGEVPPDGVLLPTGTAGTDDAAMREWKDFGVHFSKKSLEGNRKALPVLWSGKKQRDALGKSPRERKYGVRSLGGHVGRALPTKPARKK